MNTQVYVYIKMPRYLKEYLIGMYGSEPIVASNRNFLGLLLNPMLTKTPKNFVYKPIPEVEKENYLQIEIVQSFRDRFNLYYSHLSHENEVKFVDIMRMQLHRDFFIFIINNTAIDPYKPIKHLVYEFMELKKINAISTAYETLIKKLNRSEINIHKYNKAKAWPSRNFRKNKKQDRSIELNFIEKNTT